LRQVLVAAQQDVSSQSWHALAAPAVLQVVGVVDPVSEAGVEPSSPPPVEVKVPSSLDWASGAPAGPWVEEEQAAATASKAGAMSAIRFAGMKIPPW
jgi:hypothetical protein